MAISDSQKIDSLYKKLLFGVAKTDTAASKSPSNESIASPLLLRGDLIWGQSASITSTPPTNSTAIIAVYNDANSSSVRTTMDATATTNRTWKTGLTNWIPPEFGSQYSVKVYAATSGSATPQTSGTMLPPDGTGNNDSYLFDYQAGVLNFPDTNLPTALTGKVIYIVGYRYIGNMGSSALVVEYAGASLGSVTSLNFSTGTTATIVNNVATISISSSPETLQSITSRGFTTTNSVSFTSTASSTSTTTGAITVTGGVGIGGNLNIGGSINVKTLAITSATISTSTTTGALTVAGGVGIGGKLYVGNTSTFGGDLLPNQDGVYNIGSPTARFKTLYVTSSTIDIGGLVIGSQDNALTVNNIKVTGTNISTSTTTGALVVAGGVGIGGDVWAEGRVTSESLKIADSVFDSTEVLVNTSLATVIDTYSITEFRSAKYLIQIDDGEGANANFQVIEILLLIDNSGTVFATEYGMVTSNGELGEFTADVQLDNKLRLYFTANDATNKLIRVLRTAMTV